MLYFNKSFNLQQWLCLIKILGKIQMLIIVFFMTLELVIVLDFLFCFMIYISHNNFFFKCALSPVSCWVWSSGVVLNYVLELRNQKNNKKKENENEKQQLT